MSGFWTGYYAGQAFGGSSSSDGFEVGQLNKEINELERDYENLRNRAIDLVDACDHRYAVLFAREAQIKFLLAILEGYIAASPIGIEMDDIYTHLDETNSESLKEMYELLTQERRVKRYGFGEPPVFKSPLDNTPLARKSFDL